MPEYRVGDIAEDLAPGSYEGCAHAYCDSCESRWVEDEKRLNFARLADGVAAGSLVARRATWHHGYFDGRPELGLILTINGEAPMTADALLALANLPEGFGWPSFGARLCEAGVALWQGQLRVFPEDTSVDSESTQWWKSHYDEIGARLRALGWPHAGDHWIDVTVLVDADQRVLLAP